MSRDEHESSGTTRGRGDTAGPAAGGATPKARLAAAGFLVAFAASTLTLIFTGLLVRAPGDGPPAERTAPPAAHPAEPKERRPARQERSPAPGKRSPAPQARPAEPQAGTAELEEGTAAPKVRTAAGAGGRDSTLRQ